MVIMMVDFDEISININKNYYPIIGSGSGRRVYDLKNGYVVKVAKNKRGIAQNKVEREIASMDHSDVFAVVIAVSEDFVYLIMEKAEKVHHISEVWRYFHVKSNHELFQVRELDDITQKYHLIRPDLYKPYSWGICHGRPVIIDFGFTKEVRNKYYSYYL